MRALLGISLAALLAVGAVGCVKKKSAPGEGVEQQAQSSAPKRRAEPPPDFPITAPPDPPKPNGNPLVGAKLFVDPESLSMLKANSLRKTAPDQAAILDRIAQQPQALWMGEWNTNIFRSVEHLVNRAKAEGAIPIMIAYNIPHRDCGQYSGGGLSAKEDYQRWIRKIAMAIDKDAAVVVLEPDALGHIQECLTKEQEEERFGLIRDAVRVLRQNPDTVVYIDAGHARWVEAETMSERLKKAGVEYAHGFSLNTSNYVTTEENMEYGKKLSALVGGAHFIIDTSRNGAGPYDDAKTEEQSWCNPPGRKIGKPPTTSTGEPLADAFLWLKRPGESDGECNGGPKAGVFWLEQALQLAQ